MNRSIKLRLGTRGSPLALAQTANVANALRGVYPDFARPDAIEIVAIRTSGDRTQAKNVSLVDRGGKGLFIKEIEEMLQAGLIDAGVHSAKDMPTHLPEGLEIGCTLPRGDARDAFFSRNGETLETLPSGSLVGTASPRRQALVLAARPDLRTTVLRGNVETRLDKLARGDVDATLLAVAGLERLGAADRIGSYLDPEIIVPAAGQGTIALEVRASDRATRDYLRPIHCNVTGRILAAERSIVGILNGSCNSPIAAWGRIEGDMFAIDALAARPDGSIVHRVRRSGPKDAELQIAIDAAHELNALLPPGFFA